MFTGWRVGAVALLLRFASFAGVELNHITGILATFAVLSMVIGNLSALVPQESQAQFQALAEEHGLK